MSARPRLRAGRLMAAAWVALGVVASCAPAHQACADGMSLVCLSDGTTCTCAPSCVDSCRGFALCGDNGSCVPCEAPDAVSCVCRSSLGRCVPSSWVPGENLTFEAATTCAAPANVPAYGSEPGTRCLSGETQCGTAPNGYACCCEANTACTTTYTTNRGCGYCIPTDKPDFVQFCGTGTDATGYDFPLYCPADATCIGVSASSPSEIRDGCCPAGKACAGTQGIDCTLSPDAGTDAASADETPTSPALQAPPNK